MRRKVDVTDRPAGEPERRGFRNPRGPRKARDAWPKARVGSAGEPFGRAFTKDGPGVVQLRRTPSAPPSSLLGRDRPPASELTSRKLLQESRTTWRLRERC